jgi:hypothetical protein
MGFSRAGSGLPVIDGKDLQPISGRLHGTLKVQGAEDTAVTATSLYFYWVKEPPYFFLLVEDTKIGMELTLRGDKLEAEKRYSIGMEPGDVEAGFFWKGSTGHSQSDKVGGLNVMFITPGEDFETIEGYFSFGYKELGEGFERQVDFSCPSFSLRVPKLTVL